VITGSAGGAVRPPAVAERSSMTYRSRPGEAADPAVTLTRNIVALASGGLLWTAGHFGVLAVLLAPGREIPGIF
jgi:hypothetical protein